eukprot:21171-Heterococcus_DN1.PRE.1
MLAVKSNDSDNTTAAILASAVTVKAALKAPASCSSTAVVCAASNQHTTHSSLCVEPAVHSSSAFSRLPVAALTFSHATPGQQLHAMHTRTVGQWLQANTSICICAYGLLHHRSSNLYLLSAMYLLSKLLMNRISLA